MNGELLSRLSSCRDRLRSLQRAVHTEEGSARIQELEERMAQPDFWGNAESSQEVIAEIKRLRAEVAPVIDLSRSVDDLLDLARLAEEEDDKSTEADLQRETEEAESRLDQLELKATLSAPHDSANAYLSLQAGAGGTESCDWASMLARMYKRFCEQQGYTVEVVDVVAGEEAGIRSMTYHVKGNYAYGYLKAEAGVHRLVRISPYDAKSRRHTSFAAVDPIPELPDTAKNLEVNLADLRIDTYRAGGAGGQHVNKTDSAVRITHLPTGIVVQCQNERSQHSNKATALKILRARLIREEEKKREAEFEKQYGEKHDIAFGRQIRSYVLHPYTIVKDLRTGYETGNAAGVLDGNLMPFIDAYLRWQRELAGRR
jgi:peptide chain release factor 2